MSEKSVSAQSLPAAAGHDQRPARRINDSEFTIQVVHRPEEVEDLRSAWTDLALNSVEPNAFYEPWFFLPSWWQLRNGKPLDLVLIWRANAKSPDGRDLCGFFPLERKRSGGFLRVLKMWQHQYCYLSTPLVRAEVVPFVVQAFADWVRSPQSGADYVEMTHQCHEGPLAQAMIEALPTGDGRLMIGHVYNRALWRRAESAEAYLEKGLTTHHRQELRRQRRRLGEQGQLEVRTLSTTEDAGPWIDEFLRLESEGWKGNDQTALASSHTDADWFRAVACSAHQRGQLMMLGLFINSRPIALKCNFLAGNGGFTFKIAFDEQYARFSPGVQLEVENIIAAQNREGLDWLDSCAKPGHFMIGRLWADRRPIERRLISTGTLRGDAVLAALPAIRVLRRRIGQLLGRRKRDPQSTAGPQPATSTPTGKAPVIPTPGTPKEPAPSPALQSSTAS